MSGLNKAIIIGNLGADVELRYTQGNQPVATFRLATSENWTDKDGQKQERTEWHRIVAFGRLAELCSKYLSKGRQVYVEGRIQTRQWQDNSGNTRYTTEINARDIVFLNSGFRGGDDYDRSNSQYDDGSQYGNSGQYNSQYSNSPHGGQNQYRQPAPPPMAEPAGGAPDFSSDEEDNYPF